MFYSSQAAELCAFMRDKLGLRGTDVGEGRLIFGTPGANLGVHPVEGSQSGSADVSFFCDDIEATALDLRERGVTFTQVIDDQGYGLGTCLKAPGDLEIQLDQAHDKA